MIKHTQFLIISIALLLAPTSGDARREHLIQGRTMGTTYHVTVVAENHQHIEGLKAKIDARLVQINNSMSTYQPDSEISRFNAMKQAGRAFAVSADFLRVMLAAKTIFELSDGAWDATVNPLVDLWGFGRAGRQRTVPQKHQIAALRPKIGFANIQIAASGALVKKNTFVTLDLSSIAKGYGVDQVAQIIHGSGFDSYLVEIGGEIFASGQRADGKLWRIGISRPRKDAALNDVYKIVDLNNQGFATSGDYRNFFEVDGIRYSHVIDPRTGYPVSNGIVSVSIIADNCTLADGLATAVMVMGTEKGLDLIHRLEGIEALIIMENPDGSLDAHYSKKFEVVQ
jgi:thiamine biosynthesis lipoprotein